MERVERLESGMRHSRSDHGIDRGSMIDLRPDQQIRQTGFELGAGGRGDEPRCDDGRILRPGVLASSDDDLDRAHAVKVTFARRPVHEHLVQLAEGADGPRTSLLVPVEGRFRDGEVVEHLPQRRILSLLRVARQDPSQWLEGPFERSGRLGLESQRGVAKQPRVGQTRSGGVKRSKGGASARNLPVRRAVQLGAGIAKGVRQEGMVGPRAGSNIGPRNGDKVTRRDFLRGPPLGLGRHQQFRRELPHRGQLEPA